MSLFSDIPWNPVMTGTTPFSKSPRILSFATFLMVAFENSPDTCMGICQAESDWAFIFIFARHLLFFLYGTYEGLSFIRFLLVICLFQYIQSPLNICLDATNRSKYVLFGSIIGVLCRTVGLIVFSFFKIGIWSLILSISLNVVVTTVYLLKNVISSQRLHN